MTPPDNIWLIDDDKSIRWVLEKALQKAAVNSRSFDHAKPLLEALHKELPDALLTDIRMPDIDGIELLQQVQRDYPNLPVIVMTAHSDLESAVSAFHEGAFEYLPKPFDIQEMVALVKRACTHGRQRQQSAHAIPPPEATPEIIGAALPCRKFFALLGGWLVHISRF